MTNVNPLLAEVLVKELELDEAQHMIDHGRKTLFGRLPFVRSRLNERQLILDSQRIRIEAAKTYLTAQDPQ